jgi:hypothetical protein
MEGQNEQTNDDLISKLKFVFARKNVCLPPSHKLSGMGIFAMTIWNSTCNPCFSTFDQIFFVFHGLKTGFFFLFIEA